MDIIIDIIKESTISFEYYNPLPSLEGIMLPAHTVCWHVIPLDPKSTWTIYGKGETVNPGLDWRSPPGYVGLPCWDQTRSERAEGRRPV